MVGKIMDLPLFGVEEINEQLMVRCVHPVVQPSEWLVVFKILSFKSPRNCLAQCKYSTCHPEVAQPSTSTFVIVKISQLKIRIGEVNLEGLVIWVIVWDDVTNRLLDKAGAIKTMLARIDPTYHGVHNQKSIGY